MAGSQQMHQTMISYQWDSQADAVRIKEALEEQGYKVWMDIEQMSGNIYEKMSEAVETSDLIIVCMSGKYEVSENCNRELQYAQDLRKKIIPVKIEREYKPRGPLRLIVSGALYVDFSDPVQFDEKMKELQFEITRILGNHDGHDKKPVPNRGKSFSY